MATADRRDPFRSFNFQLEIDGVPLGAFAEVSGLTAEGDAVDYREGTDRQNNVRKLVGLRKFGNITLKRGYTHGPLAVGLVHATSSTASPTGATSRSC